MDGWREANRGDLDPLVLSAGTSGSRGGLLVSGGGCWGTGETLDERLNVKPPKYNPVEK